MSRITYEGNDKKMDERFTKNAQGIISRVHSMDEMNQYFETRGIAVLRSYESDRQRYRFLLKKGDVTRTYYFHYPLTETFAERHDQMTKACEDMAKVFLDEVTRHEYLKNDIQVTVESLYPSVMIVPRQLAPEKVYFNDPVTVVIWNDGTKTIVRCSENDIYDPEKGLAMAFCKKMFGNDNTFKKHFKKWLPEESESVQFAKLGERVSEGLQAGLADGVNSLSLGLVKAVNRLLKKKTEENNEQ